MIELVWLRTRKDAQHFSIFGRKLTLKAFNKIKIHLTVFMCAMRSLALAFTRINFHYNEVSICLCYCLFSWNAGRNSFIPLLFLCAGSFNVYFSLSIFLLDSSAFVESFLYSPAYWLKCCKNKTNQASKCMYTLNCDKRLQSNWKQNTQFQVLKRTKNCH